jgi:hypothetical protein
MMFVESPWFSHWREEHLDDEAFRTLQNLLILNPESGASIAGSGGLRKLRIALPGRGKRGGARLIYYWRTGEERFYLLLAYAKNVQDDLTTKQLRRLKAAMTEDLGNG